MTSTIINSKLNISKDVLVSIAEIAINEVEGIHTHDVSLTDKIKKNPAVKVVQQGENLIVDASVSITHGKIIGPLVAKAQENVITSIETMTSLKVKAVNINVVALTDATIKA